MVIRDALPQDSDMKVTLLTSASDKPQPGDFIDPANARLLKEGGTEGMTFGWKCIKQTEKEIEL